MASKKRGVDEKVKKSGRKIPSSSKDKSSNKKNKVNKDKDMLDKSKKTQLNENIIALILISIGIFFVLALTSEAMGFIGKGISLLFKGLFGNLAFIIFLLMVIIGGLKLIYQDRLSIRNIKKGFYIFSFIELVLGYGLISYSKLPMSMLSFSTIKNIFVESSEGLNMGVIPSLIMMGFRASIGRVGAVVLFIIMAVFITIFYFKISPKQMMDGTKKSATEIGRVISSTKERVLNFVSEEVELTEDELARITPDPRFSRLEKDDYVYRDKKPSSFLEYNDMEKLYADVEDFTSEENLEKPIKQIMSKFSMVNLDLDEDKVSRPSFMEEVSNYAKEVKDEAKLQGVDWLGSESEVPKLAPEIIAASEILSSEKFVNEIKGPEYIEVDYNEAAGGAKEINPVDILEKERIMKKVEETGSFLVEDQEFVKEYILPPLWLLKEHIVGKRDMDGRNRNAKILEDTLKIFGIEANVVNISVGPSITRYELQPKAGTKVSKIVSLTDDLSLALAAESIRIEAPIPGKPFVGIEVSNKTSEMVGFRSVVESKGFTDQKSKIAVALGKDVTGSNVYADLGKMPHLLVAGSTGAGKSVCINTLICSILMASTPAEVKFIMIDPKVVELSIYNDIGHLLIPVVTDMKKAPYALNWAVNEMEKRYKLFAEQRVKDIGGYNEKFPNMKLPYIVIIVDELADLMMVSPKEVEEAICRLAQKARACGMHLVIATQRPSVDVITGLIKANIPSRIAFAVSSAIDSRTILDIGGAEKLLGKGDMLYAPIGSNKPLRVQGAFISEKEVSNIVSFVKEQWPFKKDQPDIIAETKKKIEEVKESQEEDPLIKDIIEFALEAGQISTSLVQRRFRIGFNRAARITEELELRGIIGPADGGRPRKVIALEDVIDQDESEDEI
ncbi:MAG: DNA translocase FtsK [Filifactoraceae bacterium]